MGAWEKKMRYIDDFGPDIISQGSLTNTILNSRLIICTYPQTTFSEAMYSGVPTIILYDEKLWEVQPIYVELIKLLKDSGIMHTDEILAAQHVDSIAIDPMAWWNKPKTILARNKFSELCLTIEPNSLDLWAELFRAISEGGSNKR
jgi:putative transferase (TIGR04331 family)